MSAYDSPITCDGEGTEHRLSFGAKDVAADGRLDATARRREKSALPVPQPAKSMMNREQAAENWE